MNKLFAYIYGLGLGAGLMYYLDPVQGNRRRALVRDQLMGMRNDLDDGIQVGFRDLQNRTRGIVAETTSRFSKDPSNDWVIAERARAKLGVLTPHPRALDVTAQNGRLILEGDILEQDVERLRTGLAQVRGVTGIDDRLHVHVEPGDIQSLQGGSEQMTVSRGAWTPSTRLLAGIGSLYLFLRSRRGGFFGPFFTMGSLALGLRTIVNRPYSEMFGTGQETDLIRINKTIQIDAPVEDIFGLWANFTEFPRFMAHVKEIRDMGNGRSHWIVDGPAGVPVEFDTIVTQEIPEELIAWRSMEDSPIKHNGQVRFRQSRQGGTQVNVHMAYNPPAGVIGHAVAAFFGSDPKSEMDDDLMRLKALFETGVETSGEENMRQRRMNQR